MKMGYETYVDTKHTPTLKDETVCTFYVEPAKGVKFTRACGGVAAESSIGTWTDLTTMDPKRAKKLMARVFYLNEKTGICKISYPDELFELGNMSQILSSIAGNVYSLKEIEHLRLVDVEFSKNVVRSFKGPEFGVKDIRKMTRVKNRPLAGSIYKPKLGSTAKEMAQRAYEVYSAGLDFTKDDENLGSMTFCSFEERVQLITDVMDRIKSEQGRTVIYAANVTCSPFNKMLERCDIVKENGGNCIMVDILTAGFSAVQAVTEARYGTLIHGHRAGHSMFTRSPIHGMSTMVFSKISRLIGITELHAGTGVGKMDGKAQEVKEIFAMLRSPWETIKPTMPVASGGLYPGVVPAMLEMLGTDLIYNAGGGLWGHPEGPTAGTLALRQAADCFLEGQKIEEYAKTHHELKVAMDHWGYIDSRGRKIEGKE